MRNLYLHKLIIYMEKFYLIQINLNYKKLSFDNTFACRI